MRLATEEREVDDAARVNSQGTRLGGTDIFRGAVVIITAIVIGGFVISRGIDQPSTDELTSSGTTAIDPAAAGDGTMDDADGAGQSTATSVIDDSSTVVTSAGDADPAMAESADAADPATPAEETTPPAPAIRPPAEVRVLVLNGAGTQGIAARGTEALKAASYITGAPKNADSQQPSVILHAEGFEAEAAAVAAVFGAGLETLVKPLDPAAPPIDDTQGASVIVVIGNDNAIPVP